MQRQFHKEKQSSRVVQGGWLASRCLAWLADLATVSVGRLIGQEADRQRGGGGSCLLLRCKIDKQHKKRQQTGLIVRCGGRARARVDKDGNWGSGFGWRSVGCVVSSLQRVVPRLGSRRSFFSELRGTSRCLGWSQGLDWAGWTGWLPFSSGYLAEV